MPLLNNPKYTDLPIFLTKNRYTNDFNVVLDKNTIRASIKNIILTKNRERPFNTSFGTRIYDSLFSTEKLEILEYEIINLIYPAIVKNEPRVDAQSLKVSLEEKIKNQKRNLFITLGMKLINSDETVTIIITL